MKVVVALVCAASVITTVSADSRSRSHEAGDRLTASPRIGRTSTGTVRVLDPFAALEAAVRSRLHVFDATGARFGLIILRVLRFEEVSSYYGDDASSHIMAAIGRRGIRLLGQDAQRFPLPDGRVAFLFDNQSAAAGIAAHDDSLAWTDQYDVEGLAMTLGRKVCEHLIEGHRVECVVGWSSAPVDGLTTSDLLAAAEAGAHSTAAFRRVSGSRVSVRMVPTAGAGAAHSSESAPERARTAVG